MIEALEIVFGRILESNTLLVITALLVILGGLSLVNALIDIALYMFVALLVLFVSVYFFEAIVPAISETIDSATLLVDLQTVMDW